MIFLNRTRELHTLARLHEAGGGLAVVWGRRRIGKTRLLVEWIRRTGGAYVVADQSEPEVQRAYVARALAEALPGFADVTYPDWATLFARLAADARAREFRGPIVLDELPYLVATSPELPSVLQRWLDHDARRSRLTVTLAGSSQRMMQGLVLDAAEPLYGRAKLLLEVPPLAPRFLPRVLGALEPNEHVAHLAAWGGVPRYWELAAAASGTAMERVIDLVLDPIGPLFSEPERLLLEETPTALEVRPLLDAIGAGAHRVSEIAGRLGRAATSLSRPIDRLLGMGLVRRETPYGEPARGGKRSLYKIDDPLLRLWFRVVAPNRAALVAGTRRSRAAVLTPQWTALVAQVWEDLCRAAIPRLTEDAGDLARLGPWQPASRFWHGNAPEWDLVADAVSGARTLVGEAWHRERPVSAAHVRNAARALAARELPPGLDGREVVRALFVPAVAARITSPVHDVHLVTLRELLRTSD